MRDRRAQATALIAFLVFVAALSSFLFLSNYEFDNGFKQITGLVVATSTSCGDVPFDLTLTANVASNGTCFNINQSDIIFDCNSFSITGNGSDSGINITLVNNITVRRCTISNFTTGIFLTNSSNNTVSNNAVFNVTIGIRLLTSTNTMVSNNTVFNTSGTGHAIRLEATSNGNNLTNNTVSNSVQGFFSDASSNNVFIGNVGFNNSGNGIALGVFSSGTSLNNIISKNLFSNNTQSGISLQITSNNTLSNNTASFNGLRGIVLLSSHNNTISNNTLFSNSLAAIHLDTSHSNIIANNNGTNNLDGLVLRVARNNNVTENLIVNNTFGIAFELGANNNSVYNNVIMNSSQLGINITASNNITLSNNTFVGNFIDIRTNDASGNTLILLRGQNQLAFLSKILNVTSIANLFINTSIAAVNSSAEPQMNTSANLTFDVSSCPVDLYRNAAFLTTPADVISTGILCNASNFCTAVSCPSATQMSFNVNEFSSYAASTCLSPTNGMNITSSVTFCPGTFNLANGININASNIVVTCNQTVLNGTGSNVGINFTGLNNITIQGCSIRQYQFGIFLFSSSNNTISNNTASSNAVDGIRLVSSSNNILSNNNASSNPSDGIHLFDSSNGNTISNNTASSNNRGIRLSISSNNILSNNTASSNQEGISVSSLSNNNVISNNIASSNNFGILLVSSANNNVISNNIASSNTDVGIRLSSSSNNTISNNNASSNTNDGILLVSSSSNNTLSNNTLANNAIADILTADTSNNTLIILQGQNELRFERKFINVTKMSNLFINTSIAAVNSSAERSMNTSANITVVVPNCGNLNILLFENFTTSPSVVRSSGQLCNATTTPACTAISCSNNITTFNVERFSSYAASTCIEPFNAMNITESTTLCPGTFNLPEGVRINASNVVVTCNQTVLNGTGSNNGFIANGFSNLTVQSCTIERYLTGINFANMNDSKIVNNNLSDIVSTSIGFQTVSHGIISNNTISNGGGSGISLSFNSYNNSISSNLIINQSRGILSFTTGAFPQNNNTILNNMFLRNRLEGIFIQFSTNNILSNNTFVNNTIDIFTTNATHNNTLILLQGTNQLRFDRKFINISHITNLFINTSITAVNSSAEPAMNTTANISFIVPSCSAQLFKSSVFATNVQAGLINATLCDTCSGIVCANNVMNFTTLDFSTITANYIPNITTIFPNATNETQIIGTNDTNVSISKEGNINVTFNVTAEDVDSDVLTFNWFVNGILSFVQTITNLITDIFTSIFTFSFNRTGIYNVTVVVNDSASNDTFTFVTNVPCLQPINAMNITEDVFFCPGTFNLANGININASNVVVTCNSTVLNGTGSNNGITVTGRGNITITGCTIFGYNSGISGTTVQNSTFINNTILNTPGDGISLSGSTGNTISSNVILNTSFNGILLTSSSSNNLIFGNEVNQSGLDGIKISTLSSNNTISSNTLYDNGIILTGRSIVIDSSENNTVSSNVIQRSSTSSILISIAPGNIITNNNILNSGTNGISLFSSNSNFILNNTLTNSSYGVLINKSSSGNNISSNTVFNTTVSGMLIQGSDNNTLASNSISFHSGAIFSGGIELQDSRNTKIINNILNNNTNNIALSNSTFTNITGNTISNATPRAGISLKSSSHNTTISNNNIRGSSIYGINAESSSQLTIVANNLDRGSSGISILTSNTSIISQNNVSNFTSDSIFVGGNCFANNVSDNNIINNNNGITISSATNNLASNNLITNNTVGFNVITTRNSTFLNNNVSINVFGISIASTSSNNTFSNNLLSNNRNGTLILSSSDNILSNNTFLNNIESDIRTSDSSNNTLILLQDQNRLLFANKVINVTRITNLFINNSIAAVNSSAEPNMNTSSQITFAGVNVTTPQIMRLEAFSRDPTTVLSTGSTCSSAICTVDNYNSSSLILVFNVSQFSSYSVREFVAAPAAAPSAAAPARRAFVAVAPGEAQSLTSLGAGQGATLAFELSDFHTLQSIAINVINAVQNVKIIVNRLGSRPAITTELPATVYAYLSIVANNLANENLASATIKFKVEKSWITTNNITTVSPNRWFNGQWQQLAATRLSEDAQFIFYEAQTLGLSYFAITGEVAAPQAAPAIEVPTPAPAIPPPEVVALPPVLAPRIPNVIVNTAVAVLALLVLIGIVLGTGRLVYKVKLKRSFDVKVTADIIKKVEAALPVSKEVAVHIYNDAVRAYQALAADKKRLFEKRLLELKKKLIK